MTQLLNSCQIELARKYIILLSDRAVVLYRAGSQMGAEYRHIKFTLSAGTYSIDCFNTKVKVEVLQQRQDWEAPQIKDLNMLIPEYYTFMASNSFLIVLSIIGSYLEKATHGNSTAAPGTYKTSLDTSAAPQLLSLDCKQNNSVKNKVNGQRSSLLVF